MNQDIVAEALKPIEIEVWRRLAVEEPEAAWKSYGVLMLLDALEQAEARIQAVRELHQPVGITGYTGPRVEPDGAPIPDDHQVCNYCTDPDALGWTDWPCPTIEALNGDA